VPRISEDYQSNSDCALRCLRHTSFVSIHPDHLIWRPGLLGVKIRQLYCTNNRRHGYTTEYLPVIGQTVSLAKQSNKHDRKLTDNRFTQPRPRTIPCTSRRTKSTSATITSATEGHYKIIDRVTDFERKQALRPDFDPSKPITLTKSPNPKWNYGSGVSQDATAASSKHVEIDPYGEDRPMINNYRLLISGVAPRPIGFISTASKSGKKNLAPFSYFQVIDHDPPCSSWASRPDHQTPRTHIST
jgi:hypothetical protein